MGNHLIKGNVSLDLDNQWSYLRSHGDNTWQDFPSFLHIVTPRIIEFFVRHDLQPTIFVIGKDLETPEGLAAVENFFAAGFEIANHSYGHRADFHDLSTTEIRAEIEKCEVLIKMATGKKPVGFRGPSFQISERILETLISSGYEYDASLYPTSIAPLARAYHLFQSKLSRAEKHAQRHLFGSISNAFGSLRPYSWAVTDGSIKEVPVTTMPFLRFPIHFTYINFLSDISAVLGKVYFNTATSLLRATRVPPSLLLHATDFLGNNDDPIPKFLPGMRRSYEEKLTMLDEIFERLGRCYTLTGIGQFLDD